MSRHNAAAYLRGHETRLATQQLTVTTEVQRGDPASAIAQSAESAHADLIVMATHGKTHLDAFWSGSVTPKVSSRARRRFSSYLSCPPYRPIEAIGGA